MNSHLPLRSLFIFVLLTDTLARFGSKRAQVSNVGKRDFHISPNFPLNSNSPERRSSTENDPVKVRYFAISQDNRPNFHSFFPEPNRNFRSRQTWHPSARSQIAIVILWPFAKMMRQNMLLVVNTGFFIMCQIFPHRLTID